MRYIFLGLFISQLLTANLFAITIGIVPQQSPFQLMKVWNPIIKYLEKETGEKIVLKLECSFPKFESELYGGKYDIAYMNPYHYIVAHKKIGYIPMVRASENLAGIVVVNKNSNITDISMAKNKTFLFPAPNAFAATILVKYELLAYHNIDIDKQNKVLYVNSHNSVYKGVARGVGDFGSGINRTLNSIKDKQSTNQLTILYKTKAYPSHPFAVNPNINEKVREKFTNALLNMPKELLDSLSIKEIIRTNDAEYDSIRGLIKNFSVGSN